MENLQFGNMGVSDLGCSMVFTFLRCGLFRSASWRDSVARGVSFQSCLCSSCHGLLLPFLLEPTAAQDHHSPGCMKLQCLAQVAAVLLGMPSAV